MSTSTKTYKKMHTKEPLKYNIKIKIIKTSCFIVTCCLWVDFKNGLKFFILLKTDKYSTAKQHCGALGNAVGWFQCNLLEVSWDQHKTRIYKNWKWKLNWRLGTIVFCQDTHFCSSGSGHNFDIHIWRCKFWDSPLHVGQNPWEPLLGLKWQIFLSSS